MCLSTICMCLWGEMRWLLEVLMIIPVHNLIWDLHKVMCLVWLFMRSCMNFVTLRDTTPHAEAHHGMGLLLSVQ